MLDEVLVFSRAARLAVADAVDAVHPSLTRGAGCGCHAGAPVPLVWDPVGHGGALGAFGRPGSTVFAWWTRGAHLCISFLPGVEVCFARLAVLDTVGTQMVVDVDGCA